jgi:predicted nucleic acid-binding protein
MTYLVDSNVLSELRKKRPDRQVLAWYDATPSRQLFLSVLTVGEIQLGIERLRRKDQRRAGALDRWLRGLNAAYRDRIVPVDLPAAEEWARINVPDQVPVIDGLIAATAKVHGWTLVSRNSADVAATGVKLLNPFAPAE